jgi:predicted enzyme related to lactoylglutathione lyase
MSERTDYPPGAPCWVETLQPDPRAAAEFYGALFGWRFDGGRARLGDRLVAGVGQAPDTLPVGAWITYVRVDTVEAALARVVDAGGAVMLGPVDAAPDGRLAVVSDPAGIAFGLWQPGERVGAELVNEPGTWAMSALHTPGPERAASFYRAVFGWELETLPGGPFALWRLPGHAGGEPGRPLPQDVVAVMAPIEEPSAVPPHWAVNFRVDDVDATAETATALGGALIMPPTDAAGFRNAVIADPQQGVIAISAPGRV